MLKRWKSLSSKVVQKNPWWTYKLDAYQIPEGVAGEYLYVHTEGSSMVVPIRQDGKLILVNQYRYLCDRESIEFPCGGIKPGKSADQMAAIELQEETGYRADRMEKIGEFNPFNGVTNEYCSLYIANGLHASRATPDVTEEFEILSCLPAEIDTMIGEGRIWDGMTLAAWAIVRQKQLSRFIT
jgi:8-oxo-dGTP pyrophosphatase MutT (NUDIX family)